jgi:hypothetical protein
LLTLFLTSFHQFRHLKQHNRFKYNRHQDFNSFKHHNK